MTVTTPEESEVLMQEAKEKENRFVPGKHFIQVSGKDYLPAQFRILWFNEENKEGPMSIITECVMVDYDRPFQKEVIIKGQTGERKEQKTVYGCAKYRATITDRYGRVATATKFVTAAHFEKFEEKGETGAVGRALGYLGYGTLAAEFEMGDYIVDTPVDPRQIQAAIEASVVPARKAYTPPPNIFTTLANKPKNG